MIEIEESGKRLKSEASEGADVQGTVSAVKDEDQNGESHMSLRGMCFYR